MYIGGTLYALSTKYIQCTLDVVRNAQNSLQIKREREKLEGERERGERI